ncbi:MAG: NHL repeat-containing protein [bacterium]
MAFAISGLLLVSICSGQVKHSDVIPHSGSVRIIPCRQLFSITGSDKKPFNQPSAVDVFNDRIFVLDGVNSRVAVFDLKGKFLFDFGKAGSDPGEFRAPLGLSVDFKGRICVADSGNHRVQIFDTDGNLLTYFKLKEDRYGDLADPTDVVFDKKNNRLLIVDNDNHRLLVYTPDGKFIKEIGEVGFDNGQFRYPYSIALDNKANFYVVDVLNTRVQVFDEQDNFFRTIGEWGIEKGQFFRPQGIAIDDKGRVLVSESYEKIGVIQVFSTDGEFLALLGDKSRKKLRFSVPTDICFDDQNRIYICEMYDSRISVFQIEE